MNNVIKERPALIFLLCLLVVARFIVVPTLDWQNAKLDSIARLSSQTVKYEQSISKREQYKQLLQQSKEQLSVAKSYIYESDSISAFQITQQRVIEKILIDLGFTIDAFSWEVAEQIGQSARYRMTAVLHVGSNAYGAVKLESVLDSQQKWIELNKFNYRIESLPNVKGIQNVQGAIELTMIVELTS
ncbi:hypothetical protein [Pseudoalteromonas xiamenensis]